MDEHNFDTESFYPPLADMMKVEITGSKDGKAVLLHDQPLPAILKWADFDADTGQVTLSYDTGKAQLLGLPMNRPLVAALRKARHLTIFRLDNGKIGDFSIVTFNIVGGG